jgi:hypothetical protein
MYMYINFKEHLINMITQYIKNSYNTVISYGKFLTRNLQEVLKNIVTLYTQYMKSLQKPNAIQLF